MIFDDDAADRYSRHVLLPEIGPEGQRRLLDTCVSVTGAHPARGFTTDLLARSGLVVDPARGDVAVHLGASPDPALSTPCVVGWTSGDLLQVAVLIGRPCPACLRITDADGATAPIAAQALATVVATTVVLRVVTPPATSTQVTLDLRSGHLEERPLAAAGCPRCPPAPVQA